MSVTDRPSSDLDVQHGLQLLLGASLTEQTFVCLTDDSGVVLFWNDFACSITGYDAAEVVGHKRIWSWLRTRKRLLPGMAASSTLECPPFL